MHQLMQRFGTLPVIIFTLIYFAGVHLVNILLYKMGAHDMLKKIAGDFWDGIKKQDTIFTTLLISVMLGIVYAVTLGLFFVVIASSWIFLLGFAIYSTVAYGG